jgi:hypothetical protein
MRRRKTHFEQIPVEHVKRVARKLHDGNEANVTFESPDAKREPYAIAITAERSKTVAQSKRARQGERNG